MNQDLFPVRLQIQTLVFVHIVIRDEACKKLLRLQPILNSEIPISEFLNSRQTEFFIAASQEIGGHKTETYK